MGRGNDGAPDRVLNVPTNEAWIDPWVVHLRKLGVQFQRRPDGRGARGASAAASPPPASATAAARRRRVEADWFVCAMPVERARRVLGPATSRGSTRRSNGHRRAVRRLDVRHPVLPAAQGRHHARPPDVRRRAVGADRAHPGRSSGRTRDFARDYGDGTAVDCLSVDISDWDTPGMLFGKPAKRCTREEIAQGGVGADQGAPHGTATSCPTTSCTRGSSTRAIAWSREARRRTATTTPLLVNTVGTWEKRPKAQTQDPEPVPRRRLRADRHRPGDDGGRQRVRPRGRRTRCSTRPGRRPSRRRCTSSTTRPSSRRQGAPTPSCTRPASRTRSTSDERRRARRRGRRRRHAARGRRRRSRSRARGGGWSRSTACAFPADTISTHLLFPGGVAELQALGALERVQALGAPPLPRALVAGAGRSRVRGDYTPVDGIDYALCVRRPGLDAALVDTAREAGADVREGARVTELVMRRRPRGGRALDRADGASASCARRWWSAPTAAAARSRAWSDAERPAPRQAQRPRLLLRLLGGRRSRSGATIAAQWREGAELGTAFPCDDGLMLVLLQPPVERAGEFRADLAGSTSARSPRSPGWRSGCDGCRQVDQGPRRHRHRVVLPPLVRSAAGRWRATPGHFKDPVTAQGIRDALRFGRLLGEAAAPVLDDPRRLDAALARWERGARPRVPRDLPVDEPAGARRGDAAARGRALPDGRRTTRRWRAGCSTCSRASARPVRRLHGAPHAAPDEPRTGAPRRDRVATLASAKRDVQTAFADWRERRVALTQQ